MESQVFDPKAYAVSPVDLLPDDDPGDGEDGELTASQVQYARHAREVDDDDITQLMAERFFQSAVVLSLIAELKANPFLPGERPHLHVMDSIRLSDEFAVVHAQVMDDLVGLRMAVEVPND
jgi:hypothetical protein